MPRKGEGRVQIRLTLDSPEQLNRDLHILANDLTEVMAVVGKAMKSRDPSALLTVRALLMRTNKRLNVPPARKLRTFIAP